MYAHINGVKLYFDVDGVEYEIAGRELKHKPACFVVHGGPGGNHVAFKPYLDDLKQTMQLIYIDQRGSGFSEEADPNTYTMDQNVEDIESLRQYLGLEKIWILGHSYGGMVAQSYAAQYAQNLYGLLIITSAATNKFLTLAKEFVETHGTNEQIAISEKLWAGDFQSDEEVAEFYRLMGPLYSVKVQEEGPEPRPDTKRSYQALNKGFNGFMREMDLVPGNKQVTVPVLVIAGKYDWITPPEANEEIAESFPNASYLLFENSSHRVMKDEQERFIQEINDFVSQYHHF